MSIGWILLLSMAITVAAMATAALLCTVLSMVLGAVFKRRRRNLLVRYIVPSISCDYLNSIKRGHYLEELIIESTLRELAKELYDYHDIAFAIDIERENLHFYIRKRGKG